MKLHVNRATRNFGSFMCVPNLQCLLRDDSTKIIERAIPSQIVIASKADGKAESLVRRAGRQFGGIPKRIWQKLTGQAAAR